MGEITHRSFFNENVQSLSYADSVGLEVRVGIALPGKYDFGVADKTEIIEVLCGEIIINGKAFDSGSSSCRIEPGQNIVFEVQDEAAFYECTLIP